MAGVTNTASSTTSAVVLAAGSDREAVLMCNSDANDCYVLFDGGTASASNCSIVLGEGENAAIPQEYVNGAFAAVWAADGSGYLHITTR